MQVLERNYGLLAAMKKRQLSSEITSSVLEWNENKRTQDQGQTRGQRTVNIYLTLSFQVRRLENLQIKSPRAGQRIPGSFVVLGSRDHPKMPWNAGQGTEGGVRIRRDTQHEDLCQFITLLTQFRDCQSGGICSEGKKPNIQTQIGGGEQSYLGQETD